MSHDDAEDVAQQTVVELLLRERRGGVEPMDARKHARGVARNVASDAMRDLTGRRERDDHGTLLLFNHETGEVSEATKGAESLVDPFSENDLIDAILARDAFAALSPAQQDAIEAVAESISATNRRYPCIAEGLGITPAAAWARVCRARRHVRRAA